MLLEKTQLKYVPKVDDTHNPPTSRGNCDMSYKGNNVLISEKT